MHKMLRAILFCHYFVRTALTLQEKMGIHLHQDFLSGAFLLDLLTEIQSGRGKVANVNDDQVIPAYGNGRVGGVQIGGCIHTMAFHAEHERTQMLHGGIAIDKQYPGSAFGRGHQKTTLR